jgi:hypothetical protein
MRIIELDEKVLQKIETEAVDTSVYYRYQDTIAMERDGEWLSYEDIDSKPWKPVSHTVDTREPITVITHKVPNGQINELVIGANSFFFFQANLDDWHDEEIIYTMELVGNDYEILDMTYHPQYILFKI